MAVQEVMHVFCPASRTCVKCGINWHWFKSCHFQAIIYCPPGIIAGFMRRVYVTTVTLSGHCGTETGFLSKAYFSHASLWKYFDLKKA